MEKSQITPFSAIAHVDERVFEKGLHELRARWGGVSDSLRANEVLATLFQLQSASLLGLSDIGHRARLIMEAACLSKDMAAELAIGARTLSPNIRNAVTTSLPADLRRLVWESADTGSPKAALVAPLKEIAPAICADIAPSSTEDRKPCRTVLLLGSVHEHEANRRLLQKHDFTGLSVTDSSQLHEILDEDVCGIVVTRSWWGKIPEDQRKKQLHELLCHSSFTWVKLDEHGLPCPPEELAIFLTSIRFDCPKLEEVMHHDGCNLSPYEIPYLNKAAELLADAAKVQLYPADITPTQARVLIGAASKHVKNRDFVGTMCLSKLETSIIQGGKSQAQVIRIHPNDGGPPLVAKIDAIPRLQEEMLRFQRYAAKWDQQLHPRLHHHAGTGLILFTLVDSPDSPDTPAPSLEEKTQELYYGEHWAAGYEGPTEADLTQVLERAVSKIKKLNSQPADEAMRSMAWITLEPLEITRKKGIQWLISLPDGKDVDVFAFAEKAKEIIAPRARQAVVHGDLHLRNILVRDNRDPYFIDYAYCGPGHPAFDLVRLEAALFFWCFRPTASEPRITQMILTILNGTGWQAVSREFPELAMSATNRLAIKASVACRKAALEVLEIFQGDEDDYLALKYIVACQSLLIVHTQKAVVRSMLSALASLLKTRRRWALPLAEIILHHNI